MIRVLLVDDHNLIRAGIRSMLENAGGISILGEAASAEEALDFLSRETVDVLVVDIQMPGMPVKELIQKVSADLPCIILSSTNDVSLAQELLALGAVAYVTKASDSDHLALALKKAASGERYISPDMSHQIAQKALREKIYVVSPFEVLSSREKETLKLISQGKRIKDIAETLEIHPKTINTYRRRIFDKLGVTNDVDLIKFLTRHRFDHHS